MFAHGVEGSGSAQGSPRSPPGASVCFLAATASGCVTVSSGSVAMPATSRLDSDASALRFSKKPLDISPENRRRFEEFLLGIIEDESNSAKDVEELHHRYYVRTYHELTGRS